MNTYLISVRPTWADAFFTNNPKTIELRKGSFGASLKPGDVIAIYATMPTAEVLGIVRVLKRGSLPIDRLWRASEQGMLAKVSRAQFDAYYANQESGIGVWVGGKASLKTFLAVFDRQSIAIITVWVTIAILDFRFGMQECKD
jgi:predicted transcriptional regulator